MSKKTNLYVYVATAGIGRMSFGAWLAGEKIDRSDGDDVGTYARLPDALAAAGARIERQLLQEPWRPSVLEWNTPASVVTKQGADVLAVVLTFNGEEFLAGWFEGVGKIVSAESGVTPTEALRRLGEAKEAMLSHHAWVMEQS